MSTSTLEPIKSPFMTITIHPSSFYPSPIAMTSACSTHQTGKAAKVVDSRVCWE
jgi:hypothetical protein